MKNLQSRTKGILFPTVICLGFSLTGCANTLSGAKQDTANDVQKTAAATDQAAAKTAAAAHKAGQEAEAVPHNLDAAAAVTPEVKTAIVRDPVLNDPRNQINVNSHNHVTYLTGHVMSAEMKNRATDDAQVVLTKRHPNYKVSNELTIAAGTPS